MGKLTNDHIPRRDYYAQPVALALIPFLHPELYPEFQTETT